MKKNFYGLIVVGAVLGNAISIANIPILGNLSLYRILIILGLIIYIFNVFREQKIKIISKNKNIFIFVLTWIFASKSLVLSASNNSLSTSLPILMNYFFGFSFALLISNYVKKYSDVYYLINVYSISYICIIIFALFEIFTGKYFFITAHSQYLKNSLGLYYPVTVFYNTNNLSTFICMGFPILWTFIHHLKKDAFIIPFSVICIFVALCTEGRASLLVLLLINVIIVFYYLFRAKITILKKILILIGIILSLIVIFILFKEPILVLIKQLNSLSDRNNGSINARLDLINSAIRMLDDSKYYGIGLGQFSYKAYFYSSLKLNILHNFFIEFLVENGILIFSLFIILIGTITLKNYKLSKYCKKNNQILYISFVLIALFLPITTSIMSATYAFPLMWFCFGIMYSLNNIEKE